MVTLIYNLLFLKFDLGFYLPAWLIALLLAVTVICDAVLVALVLAAF